MCHSSAHMPADTQPKSGRIRSICYRVCVCIQGFSFDERSGTPCIACIIWRRATATATMAKSAAPASDLTHLDVARSLVACRCSKSNPACSAAPSRSQHAIKGHMRHVLSQLQRCMRSRHQQCACMCNDCVLLRTLPVGMHSPECVTRSSMEPCVGPGALTPCRWVSCARV